MGYPSGLIGTEIPIGARILAVVDCFDALTSDRPYRARMGDAEALAIITERRGTMYDPLVVDTFLHIYPELRSPEHSGEPGEISTPVPSNTSSTNTSHWRLCASSETYSRSQHLQNRLTLSPHLRRSWTMLARRLQAVAELLSTGHFRSALEKLHQVYDDSGHMDRLLMAELLLFTGERENAHAILKSLLSSPRLNNSIQAKCYGHLAYIVKQRDGVSPALALYEKSLRLAEAANDLDQACRTQPVDARGES